MNLHQIPLFGMIKGKLSHLGQRERLIAQNVANANTPGYVPTDLKTFTLPSASKPGGVQMVAPSRTNSAHLSGTKPAGQGGYKPVDAPDSETTLDGNRVVLEEQMLKMAEARVEYDAAIGFYQKSLNLIRLASRAPGR